MHDQVTRQIRNVALIGHHGVGKTTLAEAILHRAGVTNRPGSIEAGTTVLDRDPEEIQRKSSVSLGVASFDWTTPDGSTFWINLLDTPGHPDFEAEFDSALSVADLAVLVVSAADGVEAGTHEAWEKCHRAGLPRMVFVTREDKHRADFERVLGELEAAFGPGFAPIELPLGEEAAFHGVADVLTEQAHEYDPDGRHHVAPLPAELVAHEHEIHDRVIEEIVAGDDAQLERYLEGELPSLAELERTLASEMLAGIEFPVLVGSGTTEVGVDRLVDYICELGPSPDQRPTIVLAGDHEVAIEADTANEPLLYVFKSVSDQYVGQISVFKVLSGTARPDITLRDVRTGTDERLHALVHLRGVEQLPAKRLVAGDIGAVAKLVAAATGSTLAPPTQPVTVPRTTLPNAHLAVALVPVTQSDDDKLSEALHRLVLEDPSLVTGYDVLSRRTVLRGVGDAHLQVALVSIGTQVRRARLDRAGERRVPTHAVARRRGRGARQEAVGRPWPVCGRHAACLPARTGRRIRVRRRSGGRGDPQAVRGGCEAWGRRGDGVGGRQGDPNRRRQSRMSRRQDALSGFVRYGVQDRRRNRFRRSDR